MALYNLVYQGSLLLACCISTYGLWLLLQKPVHALGDRIALERRIKERNRERIQELLDLNLDARESVWKRWIKDLDYMLQNTKKHYVPGVTLRNFLVFHVSLLLGSGLIFYLISHSIIFSVYMALFIVASNYFRHRTRLRTIRLQAGYDLGILTGLLASKYNSSLVPNMRQTLIDVNEEIDIPLFKKHITHLIRTDQNYTDEKQLRDAIDRLIYPINTSFAKEVGATIYRALRTKENVGDTLVRIDQKLHKNIQDIQEDVDTKTDLIYVSWFHIFAFPLTFFVILYMTRIVGANALEIQFQTKSGQMYLACSLLSIFLSRAFAIWFSRQPNDY